MPPDILLIKNDIHSLACLSFQNVFTFLLFVKSVDNQTFTFYEQKGAENKQQQQKKPTTFKQQFCLNLTWALVC